MIRPAGAGQFQISNTSTLKDGRHIADTDHLFPDVEYTFPGDGDANVPRIVADLLQSGYDGDFSIEPDMSLVRHDASQTDHAAYRFETYIEYGRRCMQLVDAARQSASTADTDGG